MQCNKRLKHGSLIGLSMMLASCNLFTGKPTVNPDPNHIHADFAVWIDGKQLDFSGEEFMSEELTPEQEEQSKHETGSLDAQALRKYLHLHDGNGHVIHIHKPGLMLLDFFGTLKIGFSEKCYSSGIPGADGEECSEHPFRLFVNGVERPMDDIFLSYVFADEDKILITTAVDDT